MVEYIITRIFGDGNRSFAIINLSNHGSEVEWTDNLQEATGMSMESKAEAIVESCLPTEFVHIERVVTERVIHNG